MADDKPDPAASEPPRKGFARDQSLNLPETRDTPPEQTEQRVGVPISSAAIATGRDTHYEWESFVGDLIDRVETLEAAPGSGSTAAQKSANLSDLASAATARTNLGLGAAATRNVGTTTGTVAAGDDSRFSGGGGAVSSVAGKTGAVTLVAADVTGAETPAGAQTKADAAQTAATASAAQKSANLSDLASAATARTNLGAETPAGAQTKADAAQSAAATDATTKANAATASAAQKSANLSDLTSVSTARTNLGLGGAATRNVGTTAGTVAAGDDTRFATGGAVTSVAGRTGVVTLVAADVSGVETPTGAQTKADAAQTAAASDATTKANAATASALQKTANLSDLANAATARTNLGVETPAGAQAKADAAQTAAATDATTKADAAIASALQKSANLSDLASVSTARTNLGVETPAGAQTKADAAQAAAAADATTKANAATASALQKTANLSDLASASTARTNLGVETPAGAQTKADAAQAAATAAAATDATTKANAATATAAQKASNLSDLASATTARTNLGLGGAAVLAVGTTAGTVAAGNDSRLSDARSPIVHASRHSAGGSDPIPALGAAAPSGDTTGATDTPLIQAAIDVGGVAVLQAGTYWVTGLTMKTGTYLRGQGVNSTVVKLATGANTDVIQGQNFSTLTLTGASTWQASGIWDFGLADMSIDGNRAGQTGVSFGVRVYGLNWVFRNLDVRSCYTDGLWTEWGALSSDAPATSNGSESTATNVKAHHNGRHGWMHLGPSDCRLSDVMAFKNNQSAGATSIGFWGLHDRYSNILATAVSMNGTTASGFTGTFNVNAGTPTDLYASSGTLTVTTSSGTATMTYTGKTTTSLTGCTVTAGAGTFVTGNNVTTSTSKFTTNGLQLSNCHVWSNDHTWACVVDGQTSMSNCHWEGAGNGQLLVRNSVNMAGGWVYDLTPIATGCGIQVGDNGSTLGLPQSVSITANATNIKTRAASFLCDTATRAAINWVACNQSDIEIHNVVKTTGTYTATIASASNGVDLASFTGGSPGTITCASTNQIPGAPGTITVASALGTITCTYTATNDSTRHAGTQLLGVVAQGSPGAGSTMSTGGAVALVGIGTVTYGGTVDGASRLKVQSAGSSTAISTSGSVLQEFGSRTTDVGAAANGFRLRNSGTDQLNLNTVNKQLQLPNSQQLLLYSDNYSTQTFKVDGASGVITGPSRGGKNVVFPGAAWLPGDHGFATWTFDPVSAAANSAVPVAGTVYHCRVHCPVVFTATNVILYVVTAGGTLTSGQCFAGLCKPDGTMVAATADLASGVTSFASAGSYTFPLAGGPYASLPAGDYTVCFYFNGTTGPALARATNVAANLPNGGLSSGSYRFFTDSTNTARTTTFPTSIGTQTASAYCWFAAVS